MPQAQHWARIEALFDAAIELDSAERSGWLATHCSDPELRAEVERLLGSAAASDQFLIGSRDAPDRRHLADGSVVGGWKVGALLGRGGMGEVYVAQRIDRDFEQRAALKLLTRFDTEDDRIRFAAERRILSRLQHPGIAHLLDGGEHQGLPYAVMEFVAGEPLTVHARKLPLQQRIRLFLQVCAAVSHAHRHLIVHRDLKPGNILVTAEGRIKLLDFGIAKHIDSGPGTESAPMTRVIRATLDYCAPEQLRGEPAAATTDVYALGVILHELLTGKPLWQLGGLPVLQALERLSAGDPPLPSAGANANERSAIRGDLDSIVLLALRPEADARYGSVEALADDLLAWLESRPVKARGTALPYLVGRSLRRHRWLYAGAAAVFVSLALGLAGVSWQAREAQIERDLARREAERADAVRQYLMLMFRTAGETPQREAVTAKSVLDHAAARVHDEFSADPTAYADIVLALADLYYYLSDYAGARPLLTQLLQQADALDPEHRAMASHDLGQIQFRDDQAADATQRLAEAQAFWNTQPQKYRAELLTSRLLQSQLERANGDPERALRTLEAALPERIEISGATERETGILINNLGTAYYQLGRYDEAIARLLEADRIWTALGLARSADALNTLNNWASAELGRGKPEVAAELFSRAMSLRRELYGESAALAAMQSNLGKTLTKLGRAAEAIPLLREAVSMGKTHAGPTSVLAVSAQLGLADALSAEKQTAEARGLLDTLQPELEASYGKAHLLGALLEVSRARNQHADGQQQAALNTLDAAAKRLEALGAAGTPHLKQLELLRGVWAAEAGGQPATSASS